MSTTKEQQQLMEWTAQKHLKTHIQNRMPEEYHKVEVSIKQVLMEAWEIVDNTTDERIRLQALSLIRECDSSRLEMTYYR